jgi:hypothetical protein
MFGFSMNLVTGNLTVPGSCTVIDIAVKGGELCAVSTGVNVTGPIVHNVGCPSD